MQKERQKILFIGNGEGPKSLLEQRLFNLRPQPLISGISLELRFVTTPKTAYDFWCVDSHELINIREPIHYYQNCAHVVIIPKDDEDLKLIINSIKDHINLTYSVLIPAADFIKQPPEGENQRYKLIVTPLVTQSHQANTSKFLSDFFEYINKPAELPTNQFCKIQSH